MNLWFYVKLYLLTVPIFFLLDIIWLGYIAKGFYRKHLGFILSPEVNWPAAITFYLIYIVGILFFAVAPAMERASLLRALVWGGLYGFFTYATYDLTYMALIKGWPMKIVLVDILWGMVLCAAVASASFGVARYIS
ncbi:MAG: DUF2177 family protein [Desulfobacterales bacterium]|nr:DUF2177 family protein [Desulfobacterales bacterium]MDX2513512.1 DUF2177 family protein [Desulfobacterales bacterium]